VGYRPVIRTAEHQVQHRLGSRSPDSVVKCYHALALDERRGTFRLHRLDAKVVDANQEGRLFELWFRGVHSDVGGGNKNSGLSSIALNWMFTKAVKQKLPIDPHAIADASMKMRLDSPISVHDLDPIKTKFRTVRWNDRAHHSVMFRVDTAKLQHNNPPENLALVDDAGNAAGVFTKAVLGV
jgi:hypothetical protein